MEQIKEQEMVPYIGEFCPYLEDDESTEDVKPVLNRTVRCEGPMIIEDEETRKLFTDGNGVVHSVVFTDPVTGERRFG